MRIFGDLRIISEGGTYSTLGISKSKSLAFSSIRAGVVERASTAQPRCSECRSETCAALRPLAWLGLRLGLGFGFEFGFGFGFGFGLGLGLG